MSYWSQTREHIFLLRNVTRMTVYVVKQMSLTIHQLVIQACLPKRFSFIGKNARFYFTASTAMLTGRRILQPGRDITFVSKIIRVVKDSLHRDHVHFRIQRLDIHTTHISISTLPTPS